MTTPPAAPSPTGPPQDDNDRIDRALLAGAATGDVAAFERLYRRHFRTIHAFAARVSGSADLAGEVAGDSFTIAWRKAAGFEGRSRVSTWLLGIAFRVARAARSRDARHAGNVALDTPEGMAIPAPDGVDLTMSAHRLGQALARLPATQRAVVELTHFHGLGYAEIARILDCPVGTVKTRMLHARRRLQAELRGGMDSDEQ